MDATVVPLVQLGVFLLAVMVLLSVLTLLYLWQVVPGLRGTIRRLPGPPPTQPAGAMTAQSSGVGRLASDMAAVAALDGALQARRLADGRVCLRLPLGQRDGLSLDAFVLLPGDYPMRPPEVTVACGSQRLPLQLSSLASWTAGTRLVDVVQEALSQTPGLQPRRGHRLNAAGELV